MHDQVGALEEAGVHAAFLNSTLASATAIVDTAVVQAERYNVPLNTMRTWLRRSLLKLRECLSA